MTAHTSYSINELDSDTPLIRQNATDYTLPESDWAIDSVTLVGPYIINEWRSSRRHLEVEIILPNGEDHLLAMSLLIDTYRACSIYS